MNDDKAVRVLVQLSVTELDVEKYTHTIQESFCNLRGSKGCSVFFLIVYQSKHENIEKIEPLLSEDVLVQHTSKFSVSTARNLGIEYAIKHGFDGAIFHDSSLIYSSTFLGSIISSLHSDVKCAYRGAIVWNKTVFDRFQQEKKGGRLRRWFKVMPYPFVWAFYFPVAQLATVRFNTKLGPGEESVLSCGEDSIFLMDYFEKNKGLGLMQVQSATVYHPPRDRGLSKQIKYSSGQGGLYRLLLNRKAVSLDVYVSFFLFVLNSFKYSLFFGSKGRAIFLNRWKGFWQQP